MSSSKGFGEKRETDKEEKLSKKESRRQDRRDKRGYFSEGPVTVDNIRKEVINREKKTKKDWLEKYNCLTGEYFKQVLTEECIKAGLPSDTFERKKFKDLIKKSPIPLQPSPSIPTTSSALVGWRSSILKNNLEFMGRFYKSPTSTIEPPLDPGEFRVEKQRFIFLG